MRVILWILTLGLLALAAGSVFAQPAPMCMDRPTIERYLADEYGEAPVARGITAMGSMLEMWANVDTGTWTVIVTDPGGPSCMRASGGDYEGYDYEPPIPDAPA